MANACFSPKSLRSTRAIFICGVLTCRAYFDDAEIKRTWRPRLYDRVDWNWLLHGEKTLSMGWTPEHGFIKARWDSYSELMMVYLLGIGIAGEHHDAGELGRVDAHVFRVQRHPIHRVARAACSCISIRTRGLIFAGSATSSRTISSNSVIATKVHKLWCLELSREFPDYTEDLWGITASDSSRGYAVWGGPPAMGHVDGSVVPCAAGGSLPFLPEETLRVLRTIRSKYRAACLAAVRLRRCVQSADELVQPGRAGNRCRES